MPDNDVWPPKPDLPDPLMEYDKVIAAKLAVLSESKTGPNRLLLIKVLREEEGIELRQAYAAVNSYCARNGDLAQTRASRMKMWLGCLAPLFLFSFAGFAVYGMKRYDEILSQPHHHAASLALSKQALILCLIALLAALTNLGSQLRRFRSRRKK